MTAVGRPRQHATNAERQQAYRHCQRHPAHRHVLAPQMPGAYVTDLEMLRHTGQRFGTIYADPPWQYADQPRAGGAQQHYATMTVEAICALPVRDLALPQAHLHLWVTNAFLFEARQILEAWGFVYKSNFVWVKPHQGTGHYWRSSHEMLLLGVRGI